MKGVEILKKLLLILFTVIFYSSFAQEPLLPLLPEKDSVALAAERQLMFYQMLSGTIPLGELMEPVNFPDFDFHGEMTKRWSFSFSHNISGFWSFRDFSPGYFGIGLSPFLRNETVFSGSAYQLNDRFTFGGYSFGANSALTAPFPNQGMNNFDVRGSTIFMQYNVSKNFKIETRINVTQGPGF